MPFSKKTWSYTWKLGRVYDQVYLYWETWSQLTSPILLIGLIVLIVLMGLIRLIRLNGLIGLIGLIGLVGLIGLNGLIGLFGLNGLIELKCDTHTDGHTAFYKLEVKLPK